MIYPDKNSAPLGNYAAQSVNSLLSFQYW